MNKIHLQSSDGVILTTDHDVLKLSRILSKMIADSGLVKSGRDTVVTLETVRAEVLQKILEWCEHHKNDPVNEDVDEDEPRTKRSICEVLSRMDEWDENFFKMEQGILYQVINSSHDLQITNLIEMGCASVAKTMQGLNTEGMRKAFGVQNDFSPEELAELLEEQAKVWRFMKKN